MNFLKSSVPNVETDPKFQNAQSVEEPSSPTSPNSDTAPRRSNDDPFASQREAGFKWDMFNTERPDPTAEVQEVPMSQRERRMSKEWDASKVPPSRFQKREGSIHATPASRDGHIDRNKLKNLAEKYASKKERRKSQS